MVKENAPQTTDINNLVKKPDYNTKMSGIEKKIFDHNHEKYITTQEFNTLNDRKCCSKISTSKASS